jgi:hypothetical protein
VTRASRVRLEHGAAAARHLEEAEHAACRGDVVGKPLQRLVPAVPRGVAERGELVGEVDEEAAHALGAETRHPFLIVIALPALRPADVALDGAEHCTPGDGPREISRAADSRRARPRVR